MASHLPHESKPSQTPCFSLQLFRNSRTTKKTVTWTFWKQPQGNPNNRAEGPNVLGPVASKTATSASGPPPALWQREEETWRAVGRAKTQSNRGSSRNIAWGTPSALPLLPNSDSVGRPSFWKLINGTLFTLCFGWCTRSGCYASRQQEKWDKNS